MGRPAVSSDVRGAAAAAKSKSQAVQAEPTHRYSTKNAHEPAIIGELRKALLRAKPDSSGFIRVSGKGLVPLVVGAASVDRALEWLSNFLNLSEALSHKLDRSGDAAALIISGERAAFRMEEKPERTPHVPTPKELAEKARRVDWGYSATWTPWPKYDHSPSGLLSFIIEANTYSGLRRTFSDGKTQSLEAMTTDILAAFASHAALLDENRRKAEEARRQSEIAKARRERQKAFEQREERRGVFVDAVAAALAERAKLASVLDHLNATFSTEHPPDGMQSWVTRRLAEVDALVSPTFLNISTRHAKIDFDETRAAKAPAQPSWHYPRVVELQFWKIDAEAGSATSQTALQWSVSAGLIPVSSGDECA